MQTLPVGVPKVMISTVASGDVSRYVGPSDIMMLYSVTDVQGLNSISRKVLANGAHAVAGMVANRADETSPRARARARAAAPDRPAIGLTMFGVTTPCVRQVCARLEERYDCLVFHATGTGGRSMEKLLDSGHLAGVLDITTTEVCDLMMGGVFPATEDRFGAAIRTRAPYVGACGALDMVNFGPYDTVPERYRARNLHRHNPQVTLMRTSAEENVRMGRWIGERLNRMDGPVRFFLPEGWAVAARCPGAGVPRLRGRCGAVRGAGGHGAPDRLPPAHAGAAPRQRSGIQRCARRGVRGGGGCADVAGTYQDVGALLRGRQRWQVS